jgi:hypothetical protein
MVENYKMPPETIPQNSLSWAGAATCHKRQLTEYTCPPEHALFEQQPALAPLPDDFWVTQLGDNVSNVPAIATQA